MEDQEETLVLNYLDEDFGSHTEYESQSSIDPKLDESLDENQNPKLDIKEEIIATPETPKKLIVVLEKKELTPIKLNNSSRNKKEIINTKPTDIVALHGVKRKRGRPSQEVKDTPKGLKIKTLKSPTFKTPESKTLTQKKLDFFVLPKTPKTSEPSDTINNEANTVIKVENDDEETLERPIVNTNLNNNGNNEDIDLKYETVEQIHTEFKYESLSETEEVIRKKKQALNIIPKKKKPLKSPKSMIQAPLKGSKIMFQELKPGGGQATLDTFFKVVEQVVHLKPKCKLPSTTIFKCEQCLYIGNSRANLERHTLIHRSPDDILWYKCTDCEYKSKYEHQLKGHSLIHKNPEDILYFQCPHCEVKCSRKHNLTNHIRSIHSDRVNSFGCAECSYRTFSKDRLAAHIKMHSREVFTCDLCKFVTKRKEYLESHMKTKHMEVKRAFPCDTCSYKGKTKRELDRHYDRMHNKEKLHAYNCNHCDFTSIYKKNLEFHLLHMHQNSEGFQKFICGHCNKEFAYKNGLKTHIIRIHLRLTEDDWQKCQECIYKCKDVNTLKRHIKRNHGAPRLNCKQCSFATNRQKSMVAHMKTHEVDVDQILKCPECPYRIIQAVSFVYHMKVLHGKPIRSKDVRKYYLQED